MVNWESLDFSDPSKISSLFHYQKFDRAWIEALLVDGKIRFSSPKNFNDPWDCRPAYNKAILDDKKYLTKQVDYFVKSHERHYPDISDEDRQDLRENWLNDEKMVRSAIEKSEQEMEDAINQRYGIYCLTPKYDNELMWAHYSDCHRGICLEFSTKNNVFCSAFKIKYTDDYPVLDFASDDTYQNNIPLIAKSKVWSYEDEYRLISEEESFSKSSETIKTNSGFFTIPDKSLVSILLGCQISADDKKWLEEFIDKNSIDVEIKQLTKAPGKYQLLLA